jgi:hypothetical protein
MRIATLAVLILAVFLVAGCGKKDTTPTPEECNQMMDATLRSKCMYNMSVALRNPAYCKDIPNMELRIDCINVISIKLDNEAYCMSQERLSVREDCERKVAEARRLKKESGG